MVFLEGHLIWYSIGIIGMTIGFSSSALVESYLLKRLLDIGAPESMGTIYKMIGMLVIYILVILLLLPIFQFMFNGTAKYGFGNAKKAAYKKYGTLPLSYFEKNHSGQLISIFLNDVTVMAVIFMRHFRRTIASIITALIYIIPMMLLDWRITSIILTLNILSLGMNGLFSRKLKALTSHIQKEIGYMTVSFSNIISGMSMIRIFGIGNQMVKNFNINNDATSALTLKRSKLSALLTSYNFLISMINLIVFLFIGSIMVTKSLTTYGNILAIMSLQSALDYNFRQFGEYFPHFYNALAATNRVYEFLDQEEEPDSYGMNTFESPEYIQFKDVSFAYDQDLILNKLNLTIKKGETVALVGESGSGKSSIAKLLLGFYPPKEGTIVVGEKSIGQMTLNELRDLIAYVPQDAYIYNETIMENIRYGRLNASDEEVFEAAKAANAHQFILEQSNGYDTVVGEKGIRLSGGQCQRIAIARAILKNAPILLLDEATSALDSESERLIKEAVETYSKDRTTIIIAHRLSTIENADKIFEIGA
ncbi:ABC-type multidrug transport system fused ATPase/permease subunit [Natranaerovirga pectinivora]|uniref:ABC-type multidrug transport system fused ATPase/permease subunit n=1 Tax=Natranaerovirga pectinivora TaxID=682400 RepID=A0A4R3MQH7_9FIRM|nr:ABC transporter ATP-binding protein [Natranaerovirga pectinivora]TCT17044.1 ABC-type multidrug transport system fused ATPase/permease subunit [Natranaerovirga pectinivora]